MSGSVSATLEGFAHPASPSPYGDHTFVRSSCGFSWGCFGQSSTGNPIASGVGDSFAADCLSYPRGTKLFGGLRIPIYAGIEYGLTGVCHQAANRILYPARVLIDRAQGYYLITRHAFGPYGSGLWPQKTKCESIKSTQQYDTLVKSEETIGTVEEFSRSESPMSNYDIVALRTAGVPEDSIEEMTAFFEERLSHPLPYRLAQKLFGIQTEFRQVQSHLVAQLGAHEISPERYLREFNAALGLSMDQSRKALGEADFTLVYGEAALHPEGLIDPEIFLGGKADGIEEFPAHRRHT
jgi:hypothetical protein